MTIQRTLPDLAGLINARHAECLEAARDAISKAIEVGRLLTEAKGQVKHGEWIPWVQANCTFGVRETQRYMQTFHDRAAIEEQMRHGVSHLDSLRGAVALVAEPRPAVDEDPVPLGLLELAHCGGILLAGLPAEAESARILEEADTPVRFSPPRRRGVDAMSFLLLQGDALRIPLPDRSVDLVFGSPPYMDRRLYLENGRDLGIARKCREWVEWMYHVTVEALRVSKGPVLWVVAGKTEDRRYQPGPEGLLWRCYEAGIAAECPCYWHRISIPGSGGNQWFRKYVEYVLAFKREPKLLWSDNTAMGHPPKWAPGGEMSHRLSDGTRRNQWGHSGTGQRADRRSDGSTGAAARPSHRITTRAERGEIRKAIGKKMVARDSSSWAKDDKPKEWNCVLPPIANPGNFLDIPMDGELSNVLHVPVGGGLMGPPLAHENEAPFPEGLPEHFIRSLCPPGGIVLDPFSGSGTTVAVARRLGRVGIGMDIRRSQAEIARRRIDAVVDSAPFDDSVDPPPFDDQEESA
jgi:hypothetical protein